MGQRNIQYISHTKTVTYCLKKLTFTQKESYFPRAQKKWTGNVKYKLLNFTCNLFCLFFLRFKISFNTFLNYIPAVSSNWHSWVSNQYLPISPDVKDCLTWIWSMGLLTSSDIRDHNVNGSGRVQNSSPWIDSPTYYQLS